MRHRGDISQIVCAVSQGFDTIARQLHTLSTHFLLLLPAYRKIGAKAPIFSCGDEAPPFDARIFVASDSLLYH